MLNRQVGELMTAAGARVRPDTACKDIVSQLAEHPRRRLGERRPAACLRVGLVLGRTGKRQLRR